MFTMNSSLLQVQPTVDGTGPTPRTPEILNSLMSMTDPFKEIRGARLASSPASEDGSSSIASCSPPSLQHTRTQLIKEGLKLTIQTKRRINGETTSSSTISTSYQPDSSLNLHHHHHRSACPSDELSQDSLLGDLSGDGLTPEDEERRRRRRERNKIAATKCRMKKRERTVNLVQESEILESQNHELKSQIQELENERLRLVDMLSVHRPSCSKNGFGGTNNSSPPYSEPTYTRLTDASYIYSMPSTSSSSSSVNSSSSYHKISYQSSSAVEALYQRHHERRFCRSTASASTSESSVYSYDEGIVRDHSASSLIPSSSSASSSSSYSCLNKPNSDSPHDAYMRSDTTYTNLGGTESPRTSSYGCHSVADSPSSSSLCTRPSCLSLNTSSSDYESNTEMLDSPNIPSNLYSFNDDKGAHCYPTGYPTNSCIT